VFSVGMGHFGDAVSAT